MDTNTDEIGTPSISKNYMSIAGFEVYELRFFEPAFVITTVQ